MKCPNCGTEKRGPEVISCPNCGWNFLTNKIMPSPSIKADKDMVEIQLNNDKQKPPYGPLIFCFIIGSILGIITDRVIFIVIGFIVGVIWAVIWVITSPPLSEERLKELEKLRQNNYIPNIKCPTCQSLTVIKISTGTKLGYVILTGILAPAFKKVRSQFECKTCGYKW